MHSSPAISVANLTKAYRIWTTPARRLISPIYSKAGLLFGGRLGDNLEQKAKSGYRDFFALANISFEIKRGEAVGIIGRNGAGKSTLLQILCGTTQPTQGTVRIEGRIAALLELGAGFNPEFTGRENVFLNAAVLGLKERETAAKLPSIMQFADIGDFIDQPLKTYSSGMMVRLAFATQTAVEPDVLIVDEALSVGDFFFQQKCFKRIAELKAKGTTILFVSHDMGSVRDLCTRALYLRHGKAVFFGDAQTAISRYYREDSPSAATTIPPSAHPETPVTLESSLSEAIALSIWNSNGTERGTNAQPAELVAVSVLNQQGNPSLKHAMGSDATVRVYFRSVSAEPVHVACGIKNKHGHMVSSLSTRISGLDPIAVAPGKIGQADFKIRLSIEAGQYSFQVSLGLPNPKPNLGGRFAETPWLGPITIDWDYTSAAAPFLGMFALPATVTLQEVC